MKPGCSVRLTKSGIAMLGDRFEKPEEVRGVFVDYCGPTTWLVKVQIGEEWKAYHHFYWEAA